MASLIIDIEKRFTIPLGLPPLEIPTIPFPSFDFPELPDVVKLISDFIDFIGSLIPEPDISIDGLTIPSFLPDIDELISGFSIPLPSIPTIPFPSFDFPELPDVVKLISDFIDFLESLIPEPDISIDGLSIPSFAVDTDELIAGFSIPLPTIPTIPFPSFDFPELPSLDIDLGLDLEQFKKEANVPGFPGFDPTQPLISIKIFVNDIQVV